jgi:hypothetical protein
MPSFKAEVTLFGKISVGAGQINKKIGVKADLPLRELVGATSAVRPDSDGVATWDDGKAIVKKGLDLSLCFS